MLATCLLAVAIRDAGAQTPRPERPYRGLFGGRVDNPEQLLTFNASVGGGYDTNVLLENPGFAGGTTDPRVGVGSTYGSLTASLNYSLNRTRVSFGASASTSARYYADLAEGFTASHSGSVAGSWHLGKSSQITGSQTISYQPFLSLVSLPGLYDPALGQVTPANADFGTGDQSYVSYLSRLEWSQTLSRRATLSFSYTRNLNDFHQSGLLTPAPDAESSQVPRVYGGNFSTRTALGRFSYSLGRGLSARLGYGYEEASYPNAANFRGNTIDAGVDFNRALSFSRRTTLTFATGSSANKYQGVTYFRFLGNARLVREIGRTWNAALAYDRTVELQPAYERPVLGDAATFGVAGFVNRNLHLNFTVGAFIGNVGFTGTANGFETYSGISTLTWALSRTLALNASYSYYRYDFEEDAQPVPLVGLPLKTDRHSVQAGVVVWVPLLYRARKPDATR